MSKKNEAPNWFKKFQESITSAFKDAEGELGKETAKDANVPEGNGSAYDELIKAVKDLSAKMDSAGQKQAEKPADKPVDKSKDADPASEQVPGTDADTEESSLEQRLKKLEELVAKFIQSQSADSEGCDDDDEDIVGDESSGMEADDQDSDGHHMDSVSRAEILSPGIEKKGKQLEKRALEAAYKTEDGKKIIETLTGGKKPNFNDSAQVNTMFIAASEMKRAKNGDSFSRVKTLSPKQLHDKWTGPKSAEDINKINEDFWNKK